MHSMLPRFISDAVTKVNYEEQYSSNEQMNFIYKLKFKNTYDQN